MPAECRGVHDARGLAATGREESTMDQEPTPGRRSIWLRRTAVAAQLAGIALTIFRIVRELILPGA